MIIEADSSWLQLRSDAKANWLRMIDDYDDGNYKTTTTTTMNDGNSLPDWTWT